MKPHLLVVFDVEDEYTATGQLLIPSLLLPVLDDIVVVVVLLTAYDVGLLLAIGGLHVADAGCRSQFCRCGPSHEHALMH